MKTSKIILLGIFGSIIVWNTAAFFTAHSRMLSFLNEVGVKPENEVIKKGNSDNGKTIKLGDFSVVIISGNGTVTIESGEDNSFQYFSDKAELPEIKSDTLYLKVKDRHNFIFARRLNSIIVKDYANVKVSDIKTDRLGIKTSEKASLKLKDARLSVLNILTEDASSVELQDLTGNAIETKLVLKDKSKIEFDNADNYNLDIKKDKTAILKIR